MLAVCVSGERAVGRSKLWGAHVTQDQVCPDTPYAHRGTEPSAALWQRPRLGLSQGGEWEGERKFTAYPSCSHLRYPHPVTSSPGSTSSLRDARRWLHPLLAKLWRDHRIMVLCSEEKGSGSLGIWPQICLHGKGISFRTGKRNPVEKKLCCWNGNNFLA